MKTIREMTEEERENHIISVLISERYHHLLEQKRKGWHVDSYLFKEIEKLHEKYNK